MIEFGLRMEATAELFPELRDIDFGMLLFGINLKHLNKFYTLELVDGSKHTGPPSVAILMNSQIWLWITREEDGMARIEFESSGRSMIMSVEDAISFILRRIRDHQTSFLLLNGHL